MPQPLPLHARGRPPALSNLAAPGVPDIVLSPSPDQPTASESAHSKSPSSPWRNFFRRSPTSLSPTTPLTPGLRSAGSRGKESMAWEMHLDYEKGGLVFRPLARRERGGKSPSPISPSGDGWTPTVSTTPPAVSQDELPSCGEYIVTCEKATEKEVVLVLWKGDVQVATLKENFGGVIIHRSDGSKAVMLRDGTTCSWRISADEMAFGWADAPGMALCLEAGTRTPIAKISYKLLGRDRLVVGELPHDVDESQLGATGASWQLVIITAAKVWFDHQQSRSLRLN